MRKNKKIEKYTDRDWEELASLLSDEKEGSDRLRHFIAGDDLDTVHYWKELKNMENKEINVDNAWNKVYSRLNDNGLIADTGSAKKFFRKDLFLKFAAVALILLTAGTTVFYLNNKKLFSGKIVVSTSENQKNMQVTLPDGSYIFLNRNTTLIYRKNYGKVERKVTLQGEAFFEIASAEGTPFTIDAGEAKIKVVGTSFNVITKNDYRAVEVFVKSGRVLLSDNTGSQNLEIDSGFIGTMSSALTEKTLNNDPNYLAWNTGHLIYDGQKLDVVFNDLKKVYNMEIIADDPAILENTWTSPINNQPEETIIRLICTSFNLSYEKEGNLYRLKER